MVEHIFHICQLSHMKWILSLLLECPRQDSSVCGSIKGTEMNLLGDSFREQHLLYYIWATTYIVEVDRLWLVSTLLRTCRCVRPLGSLCERSSLEETWNMQAHPQASHWPLISLQNAVFWLNQCARQSGCRSWLHFLLQDNRKHIRENMLPMTSLIYYLFEWFILLQNRTLQFVF